MSQNGLFREEALAAQKHHYYGAVLMNTPIHYRMVAMGAVGFLLLLFLFLRFAMFSEKFVVTGYLNANKGIVGVYPIKNGIIQKSLVHQGQSVQRGDILFFIDTSLEADRPHKTPALLQRLMRKKARIVAEIAYQKAAMRRIQTLVDRGYFSKSDFHEKAQAAARAEEDLNAVEMEILQYKHTQSYPIHAPTSGVVSNVLVHQGQYVTSAKPMVKLLPKGATMIAELFIPVRNAGFLRPHQKVIIQYDAYPAVRFGTVTAAIHEVSQTVLTDEEEEKPFLLHEPYYKATAMLAMQTVHAYGKDWPIKPGMTLVGTVIGVKKALWRWIFDPLDSYSGRLFL